MTLINFLRDENGVTAIEYGLIAALIATRLPTEPRRQRAQAETVPAE